MAMKQKTPTRAVAALIGGGGVFAALLPSSVFAQSQDLPAVGNINGKFSFGYDAANGTNAPDGFYLNGAASFPISTRLGAQLDVGGTEDAIGAGLHLFMRNPDSYLIGVYADRVDYDTALGTAENIRYGLEAEAYLDDFTVAAFVGQDEVSGAAPAQSFDVLELDLEYFLTDNTMLNIGAERAYDENAASIGVTHLYDVGPTPFAVSGSIGTYEGDVVASIGVSVFFGNEGNSLQTIYRQNDPRVRIGTSPTRSGYFDALQAGRIKRPPACISKCV